VNFEEYLRSKRIDPEAFLKAEEELYRGWQKEFSQVHPTSFTNQKLFLINPIRRKYPFLPATIISGEERINQSESDKEILPPKPVAPKPMAAKPVFKPKPKMN
jgi:hypothetical protein